MELELEFLIHLTRSSRIPLVANWAETALVNSGFSGSNLNLIGHSFGSYIAGEIAEQMGGGVNTIVALDPAADVPGGYNPEGPGGVNFAQYSLFSWAFHDSDPPNILTSDGFGSSITPITADEAFDVEDSSHTQIPTLFTYILNYSSDLIGQYFTLQRLLSHASGPWNFNAYDYNGNPAPNGGYEAVITATNNGTVPQSIIGVAPPDLTSVVSVANAAVAAGGSLTVDAYLANISGTEVPASTTAFYLSSDATITTADILLTTRASPSLAAYPASNLLDLSELRGDAALAT